MSTAVMYKFKDNFSGKSAMICDVEIDGNAGAVLGIRHPGLDKFVESGLLVRIEDPREINKLLSSAHSEQMQKSQEVTQTSENSKSSNPEFSLEKELGSQLQQAQAIIQGLNK